jgi:hypothetical protein
MGHPAKGVVQGEIVGGEEQDGRFRVSQRGFGVDKCPAGDRDRRW